MIGYQGRRRVENRGKRAVPQGGGEPVVRHQPDDARQCKRCSGGGTFFRYRQGYPPEGGLTDNQRSKGQTTFTFRFL